MNLYIKYWRGPAETVTYLNFRYCKSSQSFYSLRQCLWFLKNAFIRWTDFQGDKQDTHTSFCFVGEGRRKEKQASKRSLFFKDWKGEGKIEIASHSSEVWLCFCAFLSPVILLFPFFSCFVLSASSSICSPFLSHTRMIRVIIFFSHSFFT